ncbi:MAG: hypothetical protein ACO1OX_07570 [Novosphingobium sp.]
MRSIPLATRNQLLSASGLALATALVAAGPALRAQSFQATPTSTFGSVTINTTPTTTAITVSSPSAVINWTPADTAATGGPIIFQASGTTATFINNPAANSDFAVLNRIIPSGSTRPIQFDGTVISRLQSAVGGQTAGGTVFFYSPGGILIGASSVFDVGNLALTTSDLNYSTVDGSFDTSGSYVFQPATVAGSQIIVNAGAQLGATTDGSYIAMVAPSVTNNGTINVNGSAALVAADAATITFSPSGLFDIQVDSGTSATGTVASNNGTITGPAATDPSFFHRIYMVAVPKNDAITMAIGSGSALGFDIAGAADVSGNTIVLSAGHNVVGGSAQVVPAAGGGTGLASISGGDADFTSNLVARSTGSVVLGSGTAAGLNFASDVFASTSGGDASVFANAGGTVNFAGNVEMYADVSGLSVAAPATAGSSELFATDGGTISVTGDVHLSANAYGAPAISPGTNAGDAVAGFAKIQANNGGQVTVSGDVQLYAIGFGGQSQSVGTGAGTGTGGTAWILATGTGGSSVNLLGAASLDASGRGFDGNGCVTCTIDGGGAIGGLAAIRAAGDGAIAVNGSSQLLALAQAGGSATGAGGNASAGQISLFSTNTASLTLAVVNGFASATGGDGATVGGSAQGGSISVFTNATSGSGIGIGGQARFDATAFGSSGIGTAGISGAATGGTISFFADSTDITIGADIDATADAFGGSGAGGTVLVNGGNVSGEARNSGVLSAATGMSMTANANGAFAIGTTAAGAATGGTANLFANGGTIQTDALLLTANGIGGSQAGTGLAGTGTGGLAQLRVATGGQIAAVGSVSVAATGRGGSATDGTGTAGNGIGGLARIDMTGGQLLAAADFSFVAEGYGGDGIGAGFGQGGTVSASISDGSFTTTGISYIGAIGSGGAGDAIGGSITFTATRSTVELSQTGNVTFEATAYSGIGEGPANGQGGTIELSANSSSITSFAGINLFSEGIGSDGLLSGNGGEGRGGVVTVNASAGLAGPTIISSPNIAISTAGRGGAGFAFLPAGAAGGSGGVGQGGTINLNAAVDGGTISTGQLNVNAAGVGGFGALGTMNSPNGDQGGNGGAATGGQINVNFIAASGGTGNGGYDLGFAVFNAGAAGGFGGDGGEGPTPGAGGNGGSANGGTINMSFDMGGSKLTATDGLSLLADATGGNSGSCGIVCAAAGGAGQGGNINFGSNGATSGNTVSITGGLNASAFGSGGGSYGTAGGNGTGGVVIARLGSGLAFDADDVSIFATGDGGDQFTSLAGGNGVGGNASFIASGTSTATVSNVIALYSDGSGGDGRDVGASGGSGSGGVSRLYSDGGAISVAGGATIEASGFGGAGYLNGASGSGGAGTGGQALLTVGTPTDLGNNGSVAVNGFSFVSAEGTGGDSFTGGLGTGGFVGISARQGTLSLDQVFATAAGFGGYGQFGGAGGAALGGGLEIFANNALEGASLVTINSVTADSSAFGGFGGLSASPTDNGGAGGDATAGYVSVFGSAGNGVMQIGSVTASASGSGGGGGDGLNGGAGGIGTGGSVELGVASGLDTGAINTGSTTYSSILAIASGIGGDGGAGDLATGTGGAGGNAVAGGSDLIVRGSPVLISGTGSFNAHGAGGNGGSGATLGAGGNATVGNTVSTNQVSGAAMVVTNRFQQPAQLGSLTAGDLSFSAIATGGTGAVAGIGTIIGDAVDIEMVNGNFSGTNLSLVATADGTTAGAFPDFISLTNSTANLSGSLIFSTPGAFSLSLDQSSLTALNVAIDAGNWVLPATAPATFGTLAGTSSLSLSSGQDLVGYANLSTQGTLTLQALGRIELGSLFAVGAIDVTAGASLTLRDVSSNDSIDLTSQGAVMLGNLTAGTSIIIESASSVTTGNLAAGTGTPSGLNGDLYSIGITSGGNVQTGSVIAASDLGIAAAGSLTTGFLRAYDALLLAGTTATIDSLSVVNRTLVANASMVALGNTPAGFDKELVFGAAPVALTGAVTIANTSTVGTLRVAAGTGVTIGNLVAGGRIGVTANGSLSFANLTAQTDRIELISRNGTIVANALFSGTDILASGAAGLTLASARGRDLALLSSGNIAVQTARAGLVIDPATNQVTNATGRLLLASSTMLPVTAQPGIIDYNGLFAAAPIKTNGNISVGNVAVAARIIGATAGNFTGAGMSGFDRIEVLADGLVTVARRWGSPQVRIVSGDISIIDNGTATLPTGQQILSGIRTTDTGFVDLISTSATTMLIGDGLTGSGYALSNAEIGLVSTGELVIAAANQQANATDMLIGNLSLVAGGTVGATNAAGVTGRIIFATGDLQTETPGGAIRVTGAINGTGFGQGNVLEFTTGRFELDAATGSVSLTSAPQSGATAALGGIVEINADNIHVAAGGILDRLAANPLYAGRIADLNAPASVQRPGGVLRALGLDFYPTGTLYIQNTGTVLNPAGFLADADFTDVTAPTNAAPGSVSVVVNGAFQTPAGIVTGAGAHELVVNAEGADFTPFTADSQINGCLFSATACTSQMAGPDTIGAISGQIEIISNETLGATPAFIEENEAPVADSESDDPGQDVQEEQERERQGEDAASSPIAPPPTLVDTDVLAQQSPIEQPVAGSGNPALIGSVVNENSAEGEAQ